MEALPADAAEAAERTRLAEKRLATVRAELDFKDVTVHVVDTNDNAPVLSDFRIIFNNFKNHFPVGPIGRVPAVDADVTDQVSGGHPGV